MQYSWLLLDADGTLFDYKLAEARALDQTLRHFNQPFSDAIVQAYRRINHTLWLDFEAGRIDADQLKVLRFAVLLQEEDLTGDAATFSETYLSYLALGSELLPGAYRLVHAMKDVIPLVLITNGLSRVQHSRLAGSGLADCFAHVIISDEIGVSKPDPRIFDAAFAKMDDPPKGEVLIVGDGLTSDMQGGVNYGIDTCWYNPEGTANHLKLPICYEIQSLDEVLRIVGIPAGLDADQVSSLSDTKT